MENQKLTKAEKRELRKIEWQQEAEKAKKMQQYKKFGIWTGVFGIVIIAIFGLAMLVNSPSSTTPSSSLTVPAPTKDEPFTKGNPKSKVVVTEYGDFQCPACAASQPIVKQLLNEFGDKIYFVYRYFPLVNVHKSAKISAQAGFAAFKQGKFWEMHDMLYDTQADWSPILNPQDTFVQYATNLKMDINKFKADMNSNEAAKFVDDSLNKAVASGLNSTPSFFINNKKIISPNTYADFKTLIENESR